MPKIHPDSKALIIKRRKTRSTAEVADTFNVSQHQVQRIRTRFEETGDVFDKPRSGRPRNTTAREDRLLARKSKATPFPTAAELHQAWSPQVPVSTRTDAAKVCSGFVEREKRPSRRQWNKHKSFREKQADKVAEESEVYFLKQTIVNSCGIVALLHAVANNKSKMAFETDSALKKFLDETANMSVDDRAKRLEDNQAICDAHNEAAQVGQCRPEADKVNFHFITFVNVKGQLYEFDGRMTGAVKHGATKDESFITVCDETYHPTTYHPNAKF
ncbi:uncharacterized protein LOC133026685 [Limanda limanda]|uniref:uncharacterized protein LOC133026685 n=1 Tax=Limanda limanda TaxID=27771 RepID=UPI0029C62ED2|nr:uncharacterized protein LOC133026685 [Limanda limanda]